MPASVAVSLVIGVVVFTLLAGLWLTWASGRRRAGVLGAVSPAAVGIEAFAPVATVVQFSTEICARCPGVRRALTAALAPERGVDFVQVDLTHDIEKARDFRVLQTPTVLVLGPSGSEIARFSGAVRPSDVTAEIENLKGGHHVHA